MLVNTIKLDFKKVINNLAEFTNALTARLFIFWIKGKAVKSSRLVNRRIKER
jgi:hypothetical protein